MHIASPILILYLVTQIIERILEVISLFVGRADVTNKRQAELMALAMFVIGSLIGTLVCSLAGIDIFQLCGLPLKSDAVAYLLTGIAVGGGSKPLHDIISGLSKYRDKLKKENGVLRVHAKVE